jgi:tetratricopeptide (TPR) repeat protein
MRLCRWLAVGLVLLLLAGCHGKSSPGRVIVIGLDGMDPEALDLLMSEGKMPNFAKLRQEGAYGRLLSSKPMLSPILWTTIATGKTPNEHHIGHFVAVNEKTGEQLPVTSQMRKVKALWNILSEGGRTVDVVGWWATWPAEDVRGAIVSDHTCYHFLFTDGASGAPDDTGLVYPPSLEKQIQPMIKRPADITPAEAAPFVDVPAADFERPFTFEDELSHFRWALATAETYSAVGKYLWREQNPDVLMVYIEATDSTAHLFGHLFRAKGLAGELAEQQKRYGHTVERMYEYADGIVGQYMNLMDDQTTLVVLSDHGFKLGELPQDPSKLRDMRRVSERYHRIEGILYMYGYRVKPHSRFNEPKQLDVAPTLLTLQGMSPARDMPGRVLREALDVAPEPRVVASYETGERVAGNTRDRSVDPAILEHLRALGYLDTDSPKGDRNLAAVLFQSGRYGEAVDAYEKLVEESPNDGGLRASLAGALGAVGRYDESLAQLDKSIELQPLNPEAYHNRGVIYEKQGKRDEAIEAYRTALRYSPQYEPSERALLRLTGNARPNTPETEQQRKAERLADEASQAARRGDYQGAMATLDEAQKIAPNYALVYQYRANVAFLMGDRTAAIGALKKALEIEPDNALYRTNLQRLQRQKDAAR